MLTAIKTMTPMMSTIFLENIELLRCVHPDPPDGQIIRTRNVQNFNLKVRVYKIDCKVIRLTIR